MMMQAQKRGIALFLVFAVTALMMVLLGAFVQINSQQFQLLTSTDHRANLERASRSVYEYCIYRLEHDKNWARVPFPQDGSDPEVADWLEVLEVEGTNRVRGEVLGLSTDYDVLILNNITGTGAVDGVPEGSCRLEITVNRGSLQSTREVLLNTAPLFDSSAVASQGINLNANQVTVASTDPLRNFIRSKGDLRTPPTSDLTFSPAPNASERGALWAEGDIRIGPLDMDNPNHLATAVNDTGGRFLPSSKTHYEIHDLTREEIKVAETEATVRSGIYNFTRRNVTYTDASDQTQNAFVYALERRAFGVVDGHAVPGDVQEIWYYAGSLPNNYDVDEWVQLQGDWAIAHAVPAAEFSIDGNAVRANLTNASIVVDANTNVRVDGDFGVMSDQGDVVPSLVFSDADYDGQVDRGSVSATGEIILEGNVFGSGKLVADGSVSLFPNYADLQADEQSDLSIYSGNNVNLAPPDNVGYRYDLSFRGLLYARNNINLRTPGQNVTVQGAMVARNGTLSVSGARNLTLNYDPAYLDSIVKRLPQDRVHLERAVWIP